MQVKLKQCKKCGKQVRYYKNQTCLPCFKLEHPEQFQIKKSNKPIVKKPIKQSKKPISKFSEKMIVRQKIYQRLRLQYLSEHPICEVCGSLPATEIHHKAKRYGQNLFRHFLAVDRNCHIRIENNPIWAKENGYSINHLKFKKDE